ncbi:hypothetical protein [Actinomycetospora succinea]|uniref:hypothetical protein n=1 Tax=Actinomycetospora succinea TaxID=663603 RepID=UPI001062082C|nr:hypothetical protein [Actinomycetospora succinea]
MSAWIAVVGTLGGVLITAIASLLSARQTQRAQRDASESQRAHEVWARLREERRATFVGYFVAYQALLARALEAVEADPDQDGRFGDEERELFTRAYNELLITAEQTATLAAARRATAALWEVVRAVPAGHAVFDDAEEQARTPRRELREAMRSELADPNRQAERRPPVTSADERPS